MGGGATDAPALPLVPDASAALVGFLGLAAGAGVDDSSEEYDSTEDTSSMTGMVPVRGRDVSTARRNTPELFNQRTHVTLRVRRGHLPDHPPLLPDPAGFRCGLVLSSRRRFHLGGRLTLCRNDRDCNPSLRTQLSVPHSPAGHPIRFYALFGLTSTSIASPPSGSLLFPISSLIANMASIASRSSSAESIGAADSAVG